MRNDVDGARLYNCVLHSCIANT